MGLPGGYDEAAGGNATRIGEQDDLQQDGGIVGWTAVVIVFVNGIEDG